MFTINNNISNFYSDYSKYLSDNCTIGNDYLSAASAVDVFSPNCEILYYRSKLLSKSKKHTYCIIPSIFNSPEIFFFNKEINFIHYLNLSGDVYLINWLDVNSQDFLLDDYVKESTNIIDYITCKEEGIKVDLVGHCIGANIALAVSVLHQDHIRTLTLLTIPWDFTHLHPAINLYKMFGLDNVVQALPYVPKIYIKILFFLLFPDYFHTKLHKYFDTISEVSKADFIKIEHWLMSGCNLTRATYNQIINNFVINNDLPNNRWVIDDIIIDPRILDIDVFLLIAEKDRLVPYNSISYLHKSLKSVKLIEVSGGHISYLISSNIHKFLDEHKLWLGEKNE